MLKRNKGKLILTSIVLLLPMIVGLILWNFLPESLPIHWNAAGEVDGYGSRAMAVFFLPGFLLVMHWFCLLVTTLDPNHKNISDKALTLVLWICPFISLITTTLVYTIALGANPSVEVIMPLAMGALFIIIGNYMPKCKQNYSIGIKIPWTLASEANWNATHRFAGWVWVIGGVVIMLTSLLGSFWLFFAFMLPMVFAPMIYSYLYYRKHKTGTD